MLDVETCLVAIKEEHGFVMKPPDTLPFIDKNTIGVIVILGSTYTGHLENVKLMSDLCKIRLAMMLLSTLFPFECRISEIYCPLGHREEEVRTINRSESGESVTTRKKKMGCCLIM